MGWLAMPRPWARSAAHRIGSAGLDEDGAWKGRADVRKMRSVTVRRLMCRAGDVVVGPNSGTAPHNPRRNMISLSCGHKSGGQRKWTLKQKEKKRKTLMKIEISRGRWQVLSRIRLNFGPFFATVGTHRPSPRCSPAAPADYFF
jgi:hypothetical protein